MGAYRLPELNSCVLIVEDDELLGELFAKILVEASYRVVAVANAEEAFASLQKTSVDLLLADVALVDDDQAGVALCRELRSRPETSRLPIVLMSGHSMEEVDQVEGLDAGADDYLLKPVSRAILIAKIQSVLRRYQAPFELAETLKAHGLTLDVRARTAALNGETITLTRKEFDLLTAFLSRPGQVLTTQSLLEGIWGVDPTDELDTRTVTVHISSLRNKLGEPFGQRIINVPRLGYRFEN
jgi:DNA-binding response OmpR family regulator